MTAFRSSILGVIAIFVLGFSASVSAATDSQNTFHPKRIMPMPEASPSHPFAKHHVVFHISTGDEFAQRLVLNNASNLQKALGGPDEVQIEVVAYGPGLRLLFQENVQSKRIQGMVDNGITFSACGNTMKKMGRDMNNLHQSAQHVPAGVGRIVELVEAGWTYIRP